mmetsp:Transcript_34078/g.82552  ORF Transcript_34078/g.82552 Transcript_34078/m.82552 type:complete len:208 (-) Transcript_34078:311-934(-)
MVSWPATSAQAGSRIASTRPSTPFERATTAGLVKASSRTRSRQTRRRSSSRRDMISTIDWTIDRGTSRGEISTRRITTLSAWTRSSLYSLWLGRSSVRTTKRSRFIRSISWSPRRSVTRYRSARRHWVRMTFSGSQQSRRRAPRHGRKALSEETDTTLDSFMSSWRKLIFPAPPPSASRSATSCASRTSMLVAVWCLAAAPDSAMAG